MKDSYYFQHDSNARNDMKILNLRIKYGMRGYGIYFGLIEILRESSDLSMDLNLFSICYDLREPKSIVSSIITDFDLFVIEDTPKGKRFFSPSLKRRMIKLNELKDKRKEAGIKGANNKWTQQEGVIRTAKKEYTQEEIKAMH